MTSPELGSSQPPDEPTPYENGVDVGKESSTEEEKTSAIDRAEIILADYGFMPQSFREVSYATDINFYADHGNPKYPAKQELYNIFRHQLRGLHNDKRYSPQEKRDKAAEAVVSVGKQMTRYYKGAVFSLTLLNDLGKEIIDVEDDSLPLRSLVTVDRAGMRELARYVDLVRLLSTRKLSSVKEANPLSKRYHSKNSVFLHDFTHSADPISIDQARTQYFNAEASERNRAIYWKAALQQIAEDPYAGMFAREALGIYNLN